MINAEHIHALLEMVEARKASDLYLTYGSPPMVRMNEDLVPLSSFALTEADITRYIGQVADAAQQAEFAARMELNIALHFSDKSRFRVNLFRQQAHAGMVIRRIQMDIPTIEELKLSPLYGEMILQKRGLILLTGPSGSGKSTSLAAMVGHRNRNHRGHIVTVEDPLEFIHQHRECIVTQRDVGLDTESYSIALKNALRQRPDLVVIGEIRDIEVMEQAMYFAETSHLVVATIHANNASQAIERVLHFFPRERHPQVLLNLSLNLRAIFSQRLVPDIKGRKVMVDEILLNRGLIRQLIEEGKIRQIHEMIEKGAGEGMHTIDQSLLRLYTDEIISEKTAFDEADHPGNLRVMMTKSRNPTSESARRIAGIRTRQSVELGEAE